MTGALTLVHRWFEEVWNRGNEQAIDEMMADDCIAHGLTDESGNEMRGVAPYKAFFRNFRTSFPDIQVQVEDCLVDGDRIAARCLVTGTQSASNKPVRFTGMTIVRHKNGKILEAWNNFDFQAMNQQLA